MWACFSDSQLAGVDGKMSNSAKAVSARSHEEGSREKGKEYFGVEGNMLKERSYTDGSDRDL